MLGLMKDILITPLSFKMQGSLNQKKHRAFKGQRWWITTRVSFGHSRTVTIVLIVAQDLGKPIPLLIPLWRVKVGIYHQATSYCYLITTKRKSQFFQRLPLEEPIYSNERLHNTKIYEYHKLDLIDMKIKGRNKVECIRKESLIWKMMGEQINIIKKHCMKFSQNYIFYI